MGSLVKKYETALLLDLLNPRLGEKILDAGCGTGVFTLDVLSKGSHVIGMDISWPMLKQARKKAEGYPMNMVLADILRLPFQENAFDKVISVTTLEFIEDAKGVIEELFCVTKRGGYIVVTTLNSLSPWASLRKAKKDHPLFEKAIFRSPDELLSLIPVEGTVRTTVHFQKEDDPNRAQEIEQEGKEKGLNTGAFVAVRWEKP